MPYELCVRLDAVRLLDAIDYINFLVFETKFIFWFVFGSFSNLHPVSSFPTIFWQYKDDEDVSLKGHLSSFNI